MGYHPGLGVWVERDPMEYVDGPNLYQYELSNPVNNLDPFGLQTTQPTGNYVGPTSSPLLPQLPTTNGGTVIEVAPGSLQDSMFYAIEDYLFGGGPNVTYHYSSSTTLSKRLWNHEEMRFLQASLDNAAEFCRCNKDGYFWSGLMRYQFTAPGQDAVLDILGIGWPRQMRDGSLSPDVIYRPDYDIHWLGSFNVTFQTYIDCADRTARAIGTVYNAFSRQSLSRNPITRNPMLTAPGRMVHQVIAFDHTAKF